MKRRTLASSSLALFFLILVIAPGLCAEENVPTVRIGTVQEQTVYHQVFYGTRLEPFQRSAQRAPIGGIIESVYGKSGQRVSVGDPLCTIRRDLSGRNYKAVQLNADRAGVLAWNELEPGDPVQENQELFTILNTRKLKGTIFLSDLDANAVQVGDYCEVYRGKEASGVSGRVELVLPEPDYETGLFEAQFSLPGDSDLSLGTFVRIEIQKNPYSGIVLPSEHIIRKYGTNHLYIVSNETIELRPIKTGERYGELTTVIEGVEAGEHYVVDSSGRLDDGMSVTIAEE